VGVSEWVSVSESVNSDNLPLIFSLSNQVLRSTL